MLNPVLLKTYDELFDLAEEAVAGDTVLLRRVQLSRLPLQYSELEIARTQVGTDKTKIRELLGLFDRRTRQFGVTSLNERKNAPGEYCELYKKRFLPQNERSKASGASLTWIIPPQERYKTLGETALTDELFGGTTYVESWVGRCFHSRPGRREKFHPDRSGFPPPTRWLGFIAS